MASFLTINTMGFMPAQWIISLAGALFATSSFPLIVCIAVLPVNIPICDLKSVPIDFRLQRTGREGNEIPSLFERLTQYA
jgi:hypothetical protein